MRIAIIVEGPTERAFMPVLRQYLQTRLSGSMPRLQVHKYDGRIPTQDKLRRVVVKLLSGRDAFDHVVALTDVYTGSRPPEFRDAADAKDKMRNWAGPEPRFHPHAAQFDFEAWLLPFWPTIQKLAGHNMGPPSGNPEQVNHDKPPSHWIKSIFEVGKCRDSYVKPRDAGRILRDNDLGEAIEQCDELKAFVNTILELCGGEVIP